MSGGIIYEYEDGGSYCGELDGETSHGLGVCTGPQGQGTFEGRWEHGNQISGVYRWPNGVEYSGTWESNTRHGMGVETRTDGTEYSGEFTRGTRGPFGIARLPNGVYQGQWGNGAQDGEGVETYRDHGCYRGQYRKGLRSGFGTRTSSAYEVKGEDHPIATSNSEPSLSSITMPKSFSDSRVNTLKKSHPLQRQKDSVSSLHSNPGQHKDEVAQIYEGEWLHDKRHGNGVLKVLGKYTYYGQWNGNARTGYGVLVSEDGNKEEGEWHNGTLIAVAKRHKVLMFKSNQLEQKVKEARTKSLQAAETARSKAELAVSRASSAVNKSRSAVRVAERAHSDAREALVKADTYKNAPTVSEGVKTPLVGPSDFEFPFIDSSHSPGARLSASSSLDSNSNRLTVSKPIVPSTSFEDLHSVYSDSGRGLGSGSPESQRHRHSNDSNDSVSSMEDNVGRYHASSLHHHSSTESFGSTDGRSRRSSHSMSTGRKDRVKIQQRSMSSHEEEYLEGERSEVEGQGSLLRQRRDHRTGEVDRLTDTEDDPSYDKSSGGMAKPSTLLDKEAVTIDMLNQMAKWNRMVAFLNFGLLLVLLLLILVVFVSMYYYQLVSYYQNHPDPEEQSRPGGFLTPLA